jgi:hypothetical protein
LYLKSLPKGATRLLAQLEHWSIFQPVFSPDGDRLVISVLNGDTAQDAYSLLVNLSNCQAVPLIGVGTVTEWR